MLVREEDKHSRVILQKLLQPPKKTQVVMAGLLRRTKE